MHSQLHAALIRAHSDDLERAVRHAHAHAPQPAVTREVPRLARRPLVRRLSRQVARSLS